MEFTVYNSKYKTKIVYRNGYLEVGNCGGEWSDEHGITRCLLNHLGDEWRLRSLSETVRSELQRRKQGAT